MSWCCPKFWRRIPYLGNGVGGYDGYRTPLHYIYICIYISSSINHWNISFVVLLFRKQQGESPKEFLGSAEQIGCTRTG